MMNENRSRQFLQIEARNLQTAIWPRLGVMAHELGLASDEGERLVSLLQNLGLGAVQLGTPLLEEILADYG